MIYIKLPDEATFDSIMDSLELKTIIEKEANTSIVEYKTSGDGFKILIVGEVLAPTGNTIETEDEVYDDEGNLVPLQEYAPVDGYHINLQLAPTNDEELHPVHSAFLDYVIDAPATPFTGWF